MPTYDIVCENEKCEYEVEIFCSHDKYKEYLEENKCPECESVLIQRLHGFGYFNIAGGKKLQRKQIDEWRNEEKKAVEVNDNLRRAEEKMYKNRARLSDNSITY